MRVDSRTRTPRRRPEDPDQRPRVPAAPGGRTLGAYRRARCTRKSEQRKESTALQDREESLKRARVERRWDLKPPPVGECELEPRARRRPNFDERRRGDHRRGRLLT